MIEFEHEQGTYYVDPDYSAIECTKCGKIVCVISIEYIDQEQHDERFEILEKLQKNDVMIECMKCHVEGK